VFLAYNRQRNSVLANAPPEQMRMIEQAIAYLDVPFGDAATDLRAGASSPPDIASDRTMEKYPLTTARSSEFRDDARRDWRPRSEDRSQGRRQEPHPVRPGHKADHEKIARLVDQFDGEGRRFAVIQLRGCRPTWLPFQSAS